MKGIKFRLIVMNFLIFAVWGAYLCSLGVYLDNVELDAKIGSFFAIQGIVSLFMPALMGIVADRWIPAQKLLGICHFLAAVFMALAGYMGMKYGADIRFGQIFPYYAISVAFFMPTIALGNSVSYNALSKAGMDIVKDFPPIRVFGTIGFIASMWIVLGMCLQVTNGFATTYLDDFGASPEYANAFAVKNNVFLSSISQISETLCILLIPFFLRKFGIKKVMFISFMAWFLRFGLLGAGSPAGFGLVLFILSMIVYGVAFDFFNISGSLFVDQSTDVSIRNSAQGVFMMMTNGFGATIGAYAAGWVVKHFTGGLTEFETLMTGWSHAWYIFAAFALVVGILFAIVFKYKHNPEAVK